MNVELLFLAFTCKGNAAFYQTPREYVSFHPVHGPTLQLAERRASFHLTST
jgi:hypothetical protein